MIFKRILNKIESKRSSQNVFWRSLVRLKDFIYFRFSGEPIYINRGNILLPKYKAIYFHIPKVACSSLKFECINLLGKELEFKRIMARDGALHKFPFPSVRKDKIYKYEDYFKFAFVRNPYDRVASCYEDKIKNGKSEYFMFAKKRAKDYLKYNKTPINQISFEKFVETIAQIPDSAANLHFKSQHAFIYDQEGRSLVDFIGRMETLQEYFDKVCDKIGVSRRTLPFRNKTDRGDYHDYYNEKTKKIVEERYKKDIKMFDYEF